MEAIKAVEIIKEEDTIVVLCQHEMDTPLFHITKIFEQYGRISKIQPQYSFHKEPLPSTKIYYLHEQDATKAVKDITNWQAHLVIPSKATNTLVVRPIKQIPTTEVTKKPTETGLPSTGMNIGRIADHETGRKICIKILKENRFDYIFTVMRKYGPIEYMNEVIYEEKPLKMIFICYYDQASAAKAMKKNSQYQPQYTHPQRRDYYVGNTYQLHAECGRQVDGANISSHDKVCRLERIYQQKQQGDRIIEEEPRPPTMIANPEERKPLRVEDEHMRRLKVAIDVSTDTDDSLYHHFRSYGSIEYIKIVNNAKMAYVCFVNSKSVMKILEEPHQKYEVEIASIETLAHFEGALKVI